MEEKTMREILFRGKRLDNGEWVYGAYSAYDSRHNYYNGQVECEVAFMPSIIAYDDECFWYHVDPATVGQYTGLRDKNGKRIFEGDIVKAHYRNTAKADFVEQVIFHNGCFKALWIMDGGGKMLAPLADGVPHLPQDKSPYMEWCEVIGNIHDNKSLLNNQEAGE